MVGVVFGAELRRLREQRGLSLRRFAANLHCSSTYLSELELGQKLPSEELAKLIDGALQASGHLFELSKRPQQRPQRRGSPAQTPSVGADRAADSLTAEEVAMAAAHESTDRAADDGSYSVSDASIEQVLADVEQVARDFNMIRPLDALLRARQTRDRALSLADRTKRPAQTADLYLAAGQACGVMSSASFDLAVWPAAIEQARATFVYAELIGHRSLQAWARGVQALTAYWTDHPGDATNLVDRGLGVAPPGTARVRLYDIGARAWARLGNAERTHEMIAAATRERELIGEVGTDDLHDGVAGEFGWSPGRQAMSAATAYLDAGLAAPAVEQAHQALRLRADDPLCGVIELNASSDLAAAELAAGNLDAAVDALHPVWDLPVDRRRHGLLGRLQRVAVRLSSESLRDAQPAGALRDQIEGYVADSAMKALPPAATT